MIHKEWRKWLFAPGPVMTSSKVKEAMTSPDLCHRRPIFENLHLQIRKKLVQLFKGNDEYTSIVISGSGTAANESVISSILGPDQEILVLANGEFGYRLAAISRIYQIPTHVLDFGWATSIDLEAVKKAMETYPHVALLAMVYHETSTSMINPVAEVGNIAHEYGKLFFVDAISAIGGEDVQVATQGIDLCTGSANKAIGGMPGVSFVCFNKKILSLSPRPPQRNDYLNLFTHYQIAEEKNQTPHTPAVPLFLALDQALNELFEEGLENRITRYHQCASLIRAEIRALSLKTLIPDDIAANTLTTVLLPPRKRVPELVDALDQKGYVVYPGKGPLLEKNVFQIANMGEIYENDCRNFLKVFEQILNEGGFI